MWTGSCQTSDAKVLSTTSGTVLPSKCEMSAVVITSPFPSTAKCFKMSPALLSGLTLNSWPQKFKVVITKPGLAVWGTQTLLGTKAWPRTVCAETYRHRVTKSILSASILLVGTVAMLGVYAAAATLGTPETSRFSLPLSPGFSPQTCKQKTLTPCCLHHSTLLHLSRLPVPTLDSQNRSNVTVSRRFS